MMAESWSYIVDFSFSVYSLMENRFRRAAFCRPLFGLLIQQKDLTCLPTDERLRKAVKSEKDRQELIRY